MEKRNTFRKGLLAGVLATAAAVLLAGIGYWYFFTQLPVAENEVISTTRISSKLRTLSEIIDGYYLFDEDVDALALEDGAYAGLLAALGDPYSQYYNQEAATALMESGQGEYAGLGVLFLYDSLSGDFLVEEVYPGSPAEEAGILAGDLLYQVGDLPVEGQPAETVFGWLRGEEGDQLTLHFYRGEDRQPVTATVTLAVVEVPTVSHEMLEGGIGYLAISEVDVVTLEQFTAAMEDLESQGMQSLILDLRGNLGGDVDVACDILRQFLPEGVIMTEEHKNGEVTERTCDGANEFQKPMVVLVNENTASAAEIITGALQDYGKATVVGTTTYGKGIVQAIFLLEDGSAVKVTTSQYFTPSGRSIHEVGITPDVEVELDITVSADTQLDRAVELLSGAQPERGTAS